MTKIFIFSLMISFLGMDSIDTSQSQNNLNNNELRNLFDRFDNEITYNYHDIKTNKLVDFDYEINVKNLCRLDLNSLDSNGFKICDKRINYCKTNAKRGSYFGIAENLFTNNNRDPWLDFFHFYYSGIDNQLLLFKITTTDNLDNYEIMDLLDFTYKAILIDFDLKTIIELFPFPNSNISKSENNFYGVNVYKALNNGVFLAENSKPVKIKLNYNYNLNYKKLDCLRERMSKIETENWSFEKINADTYMSYFYTGLINLVGNLSE